MEVSGQALFPPTLCMQGCDRETSGGSRLQLHPVGLSQWRLSFPNPEIGVGFSFRVLPELFSGSKNLYEFLECIENNVKFYEIPSNLACAYLKGHLRERTLDWFEIFGYSLVQETATDFAQLKEALAEIFPVVRNKTELEVRFYSPYQNRSQVPSEFIYDLLKIHKKLGLNMWEKVFEERHRSSSNNNSGRRDWDALRRSPDNRRNRNWQDAGGLFSGKPELTHVLHHEIDTGDEPPIVSRPYRYDRVKQEIIDYHVDNMLREGTIIPIQLPYTSPVVLFPKNNGLPPDNPEAYRFAVDYGKLNAITRYPKYPLPLIEDLITNVLHVTIVSSLDLWSGYFQLAVNPNDVVNGFRDEKRHLCI
ncbi:retrovirus-related Pol polyprotein from transposon 17.6 [Trichonephila clavipes]|nr:retrovirus-related Pol polyprotein from transposon 17.6 [Trichonephila clavipes]